MNNQVKVIITRGLPASGKSTYARAWVLEDAAGRVCIEKDIIRKDASLFKDGIYTHKRGDESIVIRERDKLIHQSLQDGKSVISSDTNLLQKHIAQISSIARKYNAEIEIMSFLDVPLKEVIERDKNREYSVGEQVIRRMFHEQVKNMPTFLKFDPSLPNCVISDLDGTLTLGPKDRSPYEWLKVGNDDLNLGISHILDGVKIIDHAKIFIFSGRNAICRPQTEEWLERNDIEYDLLAMRPQFLEDGKTENNLSDEIIKADMIKEHIVGKYNVLIWFDDRPRICRMLQDVYGINVAQLGDARYEF